MAAELESAVGNPGLGQEVACSFQCWKKQLVFFMTGLITLVLLIGK